MDTLRQHVQAAAARADVREAVARVYADLQREIDARRPICSASGKCCRFEEYGHRLYVSTLELAAFVAGLPDDARATRWDGTGCPFQVAKRCTVHAVRPFGCRMFFCDPTSTQWQNERYEQVHTELKRLHGQLDVPYFYVEWRQALVSLGLTPAQDAQGLSRT